MAIISFQNRTLIYHGYPSPLKTHPVFKLSPIINISSNNINNNTSSRQSITISASAFTPKTVDYPPDNPSIQIQQNSTSTFSNSTEWSEFARNVSGEWDGYGADFSSEGKPIELPESVVPEAFREWEVKVFDWQTQCPTLAEPDHFVAKYKLIKLLPTVGCEADAATRYTIDERNIGGGDNSVSAFAYQSSGCYVAVWPTEDHATHKLLELEHCLVDPQNRESRVRIIQVVCVEKYKLVLRNIKVFVEQWYGPFRNGEQLGGCAIRDSAFASTDALKSSEVAGVWQGLNAIATFQNSKNNILQQFLGDSVQNSIRDEQSLILLPKNLWCSLKEENGETCCEVGWLLEQGRAITSKCIFSSNAELKEITTACETVAVTQ